jgi:hypothetical protein
MLIAVAIITYILSLIIGGILFFASKKINHGWFRMLAGIHLVLGIFFLFSLFAVQSDSDIHLPFLFFFCSGIICCGLAWGMNRPLVLRIYFSLFAASLAIFLVSPSTLLNFILTANFTPHAKMISVKENYFLEQQTSTSSEKENVVLYKLISKHGMFHRTQTRDLNFNGKLDSLNVLSFEKENEISIRGYTSQKTFVSDEVDSVDLKIDLNPKRKDVIERKL